MVVVPHRSPRKASLGGGIGKPHAIGRIETDAIVLDIGCGSGTDLLLAARRIGPSGRAISIDTTAAMREQAMSPFAVLPHAASRPLRTQQQRGDSPQCG